jgi:hypothetical protein
MHMTKLTFDFFLEVAVFKVGITRSPIVPSSGVRKMFCSGIA